LALPTTRPRSRVLTASASRYGEPSDTASKRRSLPWQARALAYIDLVPEISYASRFYARMLSQLRIFPARRNAAGSLEQVYDPVAVSVLDRIQDPAGGRAQLLGSYGRLMMSTGEGILFGRNLNTPAERWSFVWTDEVDVEEQGGQIRKITHKPNGDSQGRREYGPGEAVAYRMWTPHPRLSGEADSPMRATLDVAEELVMLTLAVRAQAASRTTSGILALPQELAPPPTHVDGDEDPLNDPFMTDFVKHLVAQKENAGSAEASAPFVLWGTADYIPAIRHIALHDTQNDYAERDLRREAVERLARGLDFPPEVLLGLSDSNHWASLQIKQDMWVSHGAARAQQFCDDLNEAYYRPALAAEGYEGWEEMLIGYDPSEITIKPDRSDDADKALDRIAISYDGYRKMKNIPDEYAPSEDEKAFLLALRMRRPEFLPGDAIAEPVADPSEGPPPPGAEGDSGRPTRVVASAAREFGAAELALHRCREMAGNRIRNKAKGSLRDDAGRIPPAALAAYVGAQVMQTIGADARELVAGGTDLLKPLLEAWGYSKPQAATICEMIELFAARTLFDDTAALPHTVESQIAQLREIAAVAA
jgi:hypothetical protein